MIAPRTRLVVFAALAVIPACTAAGLRPELLSACLALLTLASAAAAFDAMVVVRRSKAIRIAAPSSLKWFKERPATLSLQVSDASSALSLDLPPGIELLDGGTNTDVLCMPKERGLYEIARCYAALDSPWRLWRMRSEQGIQCSIRVYPDLRNEKGAQLLMLRRANGLRTQRTVGRGREFERLREYVHGDSFDEIYWKGTARRSRPVVKVFQVERTQDVYVILDSSRLGLRNQAVEQFVSAALMVAFAAENFGDKFGLVTFSDRVDHFIAPARGRNHFSRCRETIYDLKPSKVSPDFEELFTFLLLRILRRSLLLFLTDLADPMLAENFLRDVKSVARRHVVVVNRLYDPAIEPLFSGTSPASADEISGKLAGHLEWVTLRGLEKKLNRFGIGMHALRPESVGLGLVEQYADVKRRQIL